MLWYYIHAHLIILVSYGGLLGNAREGGQKRLIQFGCKKWLTCTSIRKASIYFFFYVLSLPAWTHSKWEREGKLDAWKKSRDEQLWEICKELNRTPRHLDVGSSTFPHNLVDDDSEGDVHKVF